MRWRGLCGGAVRVGLWGIQARASPVPIVPPLEPFAELAQLIIERLRLRGRSPVAPVPRRRSRLQARAFDEPLAEYDAPFTELAIGKTLRVRGVRP